MIQSVNYVDLYGRVYVLRELDDEEQKLVEDLQERVRTHPDWNDFDNYRLKKVGDFYLNRGLETREVTQTAVWRIAGDLSSRIALEAGLVSPPDYRDELARLIREQFRTRREFCRATGISEDMLSHVLARRKHLAIDTLNEALAKIGYTLRIGPLETSSQPSHDS